MYTIDGFINGDFNLFVDKNEYNELIQELNKTGILWNNEMTLKQFNPFEHMLLKGKFNYIVLTVINKGLFWKYASLRCGNLISDKKAVSYEMLTLTNKNDFIGQCIRSNNEQLYSVGKLYYFKNGITINNEGESSSIYDSIKAFNEGNKAAFEMTEIKEVKRQARIGEYVKVVEPQDIPKSYGVLDYGKGSILKIINIDEDDKYYYSNRYYGYLYDSEYVVLEGYQGIIENKIEVGDMVVVTDSNRCFTAYPKWFKETDNLEYKSHFVQYRSPTKNKQYKVVCKGKHCCNNDFYPDGVYCIQDLDTTQVFLMCKDGIKK